MRGWESARRTLRLAVMAGVLGLGLVIVEPATSPAEAAGCQANQIAVVVSFNSLGGGTQTSCIGDVGSGLAALNASFGYQGTTRFPTFVCRINGAPASDPCQSTPPATAYWSYWTASMGGTWAYSNLGAASTNPAPGGVEGWSFGSGSQPGISPPSAPTPPPPPPPPAPAPAPAPAPPAPAPAPEGGGSPAPPAESGPSTDGQSPTPTESSSTSETPEASGSTDPSGSAESSSSQAPGDARGSAEPGQSAELQTVSDTGPPTGPPWAVLGTVAGLAVLGGAAFWQIRRRRGDPSGTPG